MRLTPVSLLALSIVLFIFTQDIQVSADAIVPASVGATGGPPIPFGGAEDDENLGMLLTLLLLAAKNRCNSKCQCCPPRTIPVPYPVPYPVNLDDGEDDVDDDEELIKVEDERGNVNTNEISITSNLEDKTSKGEEVQKLIGILEETDRVPDNFQQKDT